MEFYDVEDGSLTEKMDEIDVNQLPISISNDAPEVEVALRVKCYLFIKAPQQKALKVKSAAPDLDKADLKVRQHLKNILLNSETLYQFKPLIKDLNSITAIL